MTTAILIDRDLRQRQIVPPEKLAACHAVVIGVGAVGRQVAIQLAAVGIPAMDLIDHDAVEAVNLAPQAYWPADIGQAKVAATACLCRQINPDVQITEYPERFRRSWSRQLPANRQKVVFACVDSIAARGLIWEAVRPWASLYVDGRMSAEVIRVLASDRPAIDSYYATTLFPEAETQGGSCTARSTVYTASIAAGLMVGQFTKWLRGMPTDRDTSLNLLAMEIAVA